MIKRYSLILFGAIFVLMLAGCTSASTSAGVAATASGSAGSSPTGSAGDCTIYDSGNDARVVILSGGESECSTMASSLSTGGSFWTAQPQSTPDALSMVCVMDDHGNVAEVIDGDSQDIGKSTCSGFESSGWTEDTKEESQIRQQEQVAANAQASASVSTAQSQAAQQQDSHDQQTAESDLSTLLTDSSTASGGSLAGDLASFNGNVSSAARNLATARSDAAQSNTYCSASADAEGEADDVEGDAQDVGGDVQDLKPEITTVLNDITTLKSALNTLTGDGLPPLTGAQPAINRAEANIVSTISKANAYISAVNNDVSAAYAAANAISTGHCSSSAQTTPAPISPM